VPLISAKVFTRVSARLRILGYILRYYDLNTRLASIAIIASLVISPLTILGLLFLL
jgi:hypothetical protein